MKPLLSLDIPSDTSSAAEYEGGPAPFGAPGFMGGGLAGPAYGANPLSNTMSIELGTNAIKLLKEDIHVGVDGLLDPITGQVWGNINPAQISIKGTLGAGAGGQVFRGYHSKSGMEVAVKTINAFEKAKRHQLVKELHSLMKNECPFLVKLHGANFSEGKINVALEFMDAGNLGSFIKALREQVISRDQAYYVPEPTLAKIAHQIVMALSYLHNCRYQVHRDIKPDNILLNKMGKVKVSDFGISKELSEALELCNTWVGTPPYMSPERIENKKYSFPSDIWSLGMVLIQLATGQYPYPIQSPNYIEIYQRIQEDPQPSLPPEAGFSEEFMHFIDRCMVKTPQHRATAIELAASPWILKHTFAEANIAGWIQDVMGFRFY